MNLILAQVFTESKKANINMHERRIMEISESKDVITRFILGWIPKLLLAKFGNYSTYRPQKVCIIQEIDRKDKSSDMHAAHGKLCNM